MVSSPGSLYHRSCTCALQMEGVPASKYNVMITFPWEFMFVLNHDDKYEGQVNNILNSKSAVA